MQRYGGDWLNHHHNQHNSYQLWIMLSITMLSFLLDSSKPFLAKNQWLRIYAQPILSLYKRVRHSVFKYKDEMRFQEFASTTSHDIKLVHDPNSEFDKVLREMRNSLQVTDVTIAPLAYNEYLRTALYPSHVYGPMFRAKTLEHFTSLALTNPLYPDNIVVDVASSASPFPDIVKRIYGCRVYRQDLDFPPGINGEYIGCNAASMPLPDESVDLLTLHNSIEHFEGLADTLFIKEAARILKDNGQVVIVPLYSNPLFLNQIDPWEVNPFSVPFDDDAAILVTRGTGARFGRHYSVAKLQERVLDVSDLRFDIHHIANWAALGYPKYASLVLVLSKN